MSKRFLNETGGEIIQFDDCLLELFANDKNDSPFESYSNFQVQKEELAYKFIDINNEIVLGLLSSKTNTLDNEKRTLDILEKASNIIDKDRLYLSHQCGFASCDEGNELTIDEQWAKIDQGQEIAKKFWGE